MLGDWVRRAAASRTARVTAILFAALLTVWLVTQPGADGSTARARQLTPSEPGAWLRELPEGSAAAVEIRLDDLLAELSSGRRVALDRRAVARIAAGIVRDGTRINDINEMQVGAFLDEVPRVRVSYGDMSIVLRREALARIAQRIVGNDEPVEEVRLGVVLDKLPYLQARALLRQDSRIARAAQGQGPLATTLRELFGEFESVDLSRDPDFLEREALQLRYAEVVRTVKEIRRAGSTGDDLTRVVYDEAFYRLVDNDLVDAVPLLDGHQRLEQELASDDLDSMSRAERIAFRWEARRRAFAPETAELLFNRQEAMERYQIDLLAIQADPFLTEEEKTDRIRDRRRALKVELAAQGSYVGFPDETRGEADAELRGLYDSGFDRMTPAERREARRQVYVERLPETLREHVDSVSEGRAATSVTGRGAAVERRQP